MLIEQPLNLVLLLGLLALVPAIILMTSSFLKISVIILLLRNALGVQQIPPNIVVYLLALILSLYVMAPALMEIIQLLQAEDKENTVTSLADLLTLIGRSAEPIRQFMLRNTSPQQLEFFLGMAHKRWPATLSENLSSENFLILIPAFMGSELIMAFQAGFLLYLPFVIIDLVVQAVLLSLGMMMMSPMTISLPIKLLVFILVDGWTKLVGAMVFSYL